MTSLRREILLKAFKASDLLIMACSFLLATWAAFYRIETISFDEFLAMRVKIQNFTLFLGFLLIWHIIFSLFRLYHSRRLSTQWGEVIDVLKATSIGTAGILITAIFFRIDIVTPTFLAVFWLAGTTITIFTRLTLRYALSWIRIRGRNLRHMLIVGTNQRAIQFAQEIESKPELGYCLIGFVDDNPKFHNTKIHGYPVFGGQEKIQDIIKHYNIEEIIVSFKEDSAGKTKKIKKLCAKLGIELDVRRMKLVID